MWPNLQRLEVYLPAYLKKVPIHCVINVSINEWWTKPVKNAASLYPFLVCINGRLKWLNGGAPANQKPSTDACLDGERPLVRLVWRLSYSLSLSCVWERAWKGVQQARKSKNNASKREASSNVFSLSFLLWHTYAIALSVFPSQLVATTRYSGPFSSMLLLLARLTQST